MKKNRYDPNRIAHVEYALLRLDKGGLFDLSIALVLFANSRQRRFLAAGTILAFDLEEWDRVAEFVLEPVPAPQSPGPSSFLDTPAGRAALIG